MIVVGDSSALVALAVCDELKLLDERFDKVCVPEAVFAECIVTGKTAADKLERYLQDKVIPVDLSTTIVTSSGMGAGELEAMSLYKAQQADFLLIDDRRARKVAILNNLHTIGSIGMLLWGKQNGYLIEIRPKLAQIIAVGIFLSEHVQQEALRLAGE